MDRTAVEQDDGGTEDEIGGTLDIRIDDMDARDITLGEERILVADERTPLDSDAVAAGFERHGLPHPAGIVGNGEPFEPHVVGLEGHGITIVGGQLVTVDDLAREVAPNDAHAVATAHADDSDLVLVDVQGDFLAVSTGHDAHGAPRGGLGRQRIETSLHGGEIPAAVAVDDIH